MGFKAMSSKVLTDTERVALNLILEDLRLLFSKEEIKQEEVDDIFNKLKSDEVKSYIQSLRSGSKPETALRESFIAGKSILLKYLFGEAIPEARSNGFIDYLIKDEMGRGIALELKPLFEAEIVYDKSGKPILKRLRQKEIRPENYRHQILKYIQEGEAQFVILTNLKEWFFYSKDLTPGEVKPFCTISLFDFIKEYDVIVNLQDYLERKESESVRYELDRRFLESLKMWVEKLSEVEFTVDDKRKLELIIGLINKFIFIQTLDDYGVIEFNWIRKRWNHHEQMWWRKGKLMILEKFFNELDDWFFLYYDTELFREKILQYIKKDDGNVDKFYKNLQLVLGLTYSQMPLGAIRGIMQYNFRYIDEDVFGKAYETFLGEVRKEQGIYYTPKYITEYIVRNTVGRVFDELLKEIKERLDRKDFKGTRELVVRFTFVKVLDPACGSGSFLIKAARLIVEKYRELCRLIEDAEKSYVKEHSSYLSSLSIPEGIRVNLELISEIKKTIGSKNERELISRILVRHIYGVDLDKRALEVAKVNIWLEAIKLAPKEFRYDKLPPETNYILPSLEMNLCCGDSLVGLPEEFTIKYINDKHQTDLIKLFDLRRKYLDDPTDPKHVEEIENIKHKIRSELAKEFKRYLEAKGVPIEIVNYTKPFHWALEFWFFYLEDALKPFPCELAGVDVVIGNPPWIQSKFMKTELKRFYEANFTSMKKQYDIFNGFIEKGINLLKDHGLLGLILPNRFVMNPDYQLLRDFLLKNVSILEITDLGEDVFEDVQMPSLIMLVQKEKSKEARRKNNVLIRLSNAELFQRGLCINEYCRCQGEFEREPDQLFTIYESPLVSSIIRKIEEGSKPLRAFVKNARGVEIGKKSEIVSESPLPNCVPFLVGEDMDRYTILKYHYIQLGVTGIDYKDPAIYSPPKVIIRKTGTGIRATVDYQGYYVIQVIYILKNKPDSPFSEEYLTAVLNSQLMNFYYFEKFGEKEKKTFPHLRQMHILSLPIKDLGTLERIITERVKNLIALKMRYVKLLDIWRDWCTRLKNSEVSLYEILSEDVKFMKTGRFDRAYTSKATFYPTEREIPNTIFSDFKIIGETDRNIIKIMGLDENNREKLVYKMEIENRDLMLHIYCSLLEAVQSKSKINNLSQLFAKTIIPVIKEANKSPKELIPNIIKKVKSEFEVWSGQNNIKNVEADIVKISNEIEDLEAKIDALVFKVYGLNEDEIKVVFDSLKTPTIYQSKVLEFFKRL
jgi:type I restriction-modification system DNA methylase subunit